MNAIGRHHGVTGANAGDAEILGHALDDDHVGEAAGVVGQAAVGVVASLAGEVDEALVDDDVGNRPQAVEQPAHRRVGNVAAVGIIGVDQDDRVGPFAFDELDIGIRVEAEVVFLAQEVVNDLRVGPGEFVVGRERGQVDQKLGLGESVEDRLDNLSGAVADEDRFGARSSTRPSLAAITRF